MNYEPNHSERRRLAALDDYAILDTMPESHFDDIVALAAQICDKPIALISLVDDRRQWFKAAVGLDVRETPRGIAFCAQAIRQDETLLIADAASDSRFCDNPLVTGDFALRFYAGAQLTTPDGYRLGTLCVLDRRPGALSEAQQRALEALARQVMAQFELRKTVALRRQENHRHRMILESAVDYAIISMDVEGRITSWNEGAQRILGWTEHEMLGEPCDLLFAPEDRAAGVPRRELATALAQGRCVDERWHRCKSGTQFWGLGEMMPLRDADGRHEGFLKIFRDGTEQHETKRKLELSEAHFQFALGLAGFLGSWDWDVRSDAVQADARFAEVFSVTPEEARIGLPLARFVAGIHPDDRAWVSDRIAECVASLGDFAEEYRLLHADGRTLWVSVRGKCLCDADGNPTHFPGIAIDITERKMMEDALRVSETRTRIALETADMGAWETAADFTEQVCDRRTRILLGHAPDEPAGFFARVVPSDRERAEAAVAAALAGAAGVLDDQFRVLSSGEGQHWVHVRGRLVHDVGPQPRFIGTIRDVTAQKVAEESSTLLAGELQHRIKNTLAVVQAIVSQSLRRAATPADAREAIGSRLVALARAHDLLTRTNWTAAPLAAVVKGALRPLGEHGERIVIDGPDIRLKAKSALAFAMVVHELATNAAKYGALSGEAGTLAVRWHRTAERRLEFDWIESGGPEVSLPDAEGFGSRLMKSLARDLGGVGQAEYRRCGLRWTLTSSLDDIEERLLAADETIGRNI